LLPVEEKSKNQEKERNQKRADLKEGGRTETFAGDGGFHRWQGMEEEKMLSQIPLFPVSSSQRCVE